MPGALAFKFVCWQSRGALRLSSDSLHQSVVSGETCMNAIIDANIFLVVVAAVALGLLHARAIGDLQKRTGGWAG